MPTADKRDLRDLDVLAQVEAGADPALIEQRTGIPAQVVETIVAEDAAEFPDEPLRSRA